MRCGIADKAWEAVGVLLAEFPDPARRLAEIGPICLVAYKP